MCSLLKGDLNPRKDNKICARFLGGILNCLHILKGIMVSYRNKCDPCFDCFFNNFFRIAFKS